MPPPMMTSPMGAMPPPTDSDTSSPIDLGFTPEGGSAEPQYPSLTIEGDPATQVMGGGWKEGDEVTAEVKCRVSSMTDGSVELEVMSITPEPGAVSPTDGQTAGDAMDAFKAGYGGE